MKKMRLVKTMVPLVAVSLMISGCSVQSVTYKGGSGTSAAASGEQQMSSGPSLPLILSEPAESMNQASAGTQTPASAQSPAVTPSPTAKPTATPTPSPTPKPTAKPTAKPTPTPAPTPKLISPTVITPVPDPDAGKTLLGEKQEGDRVYRVSLTNNTGRTIVWISAKDNFTDYFPKSWLKEDQLIEDGDSFVFYFDSTHAQEESADRDEDPEYEIRMGVKTDEQMKDEESEGRYVILHATPFGDFEDAEILYDEGDNLAYLEYKSSKTGKKVSTLYSEAAIKYPDRSSDDSGSGNSSDNTDDSSDNRENSSADTEDSSNNTGNTDTSDERDTDERDETEDNSYDNTYDEEPSYDQDENDYEEETGDDGDYDYVPIEDDYDGYGEDEDEVIIYHDEADDDYDGVVG